MLKSIIGTLVAAALFATGFASAQVLEKVDHPLAVRVGALFPTNSDVRDATRDTWLNIGLDYTLGRTSDGNDWVGAIDFGNTNHANYWAFQGIYTWSQGESSGSINGMSIGLGAGLYLVDPASGSSRTEFGIPLVVGWDLSRNFFVQGKYHWVITDNASSAFTLGVGTRF